MVSRLMNLTQQMTKRAEVGEKDGKAMSSSLTKALFGLGYNDVLFPLVTYPCLVSLTLLRKPKFQGLMLGLGES